MGAASSSGPFTKALAAQERSALRRECYFGAFITVPAGPLLLVQ